MHAVRFLKQEDLVDVLEHYFVVMGFAMKLRKVAVKVKGIVPARNNHR